MKGNPLEGGVESGMFSANNLCKYFYSIKKEIPSLCRYWIGRSEQRSQLMTQTKAEELRREIYGNRTYWHTWSHTRPSAKYRKRRWGDWRSAILVSSIKLSGDQLFHHLFNIHKHCRDVIISCCHLTNSPSSTALRRVNFIRSSVLALMVGECCKSCGVSALLSCWASLFH